MCLALLDTQRYHGDIRGDIHGGIFAEPSLLLSKSHAWCSGAVSYYDAHFGLVLDKLEAIGKAQDTVVLVTGVRASHPRHASRDAVLAHT